MDNQTQSVCLRLDYVSENCSMSYLDKFLISSTCMNASDFEHGHGLNGGTAYANLGSGNLMPIGSFAPNEGNQGTSTPEVSFTIG